MNLNISENDKHVLVETDFNKEFIRRAKKLGGKWQVPHWKFSKAIKSEVIEMCRAVLGTDGTDGVTLVDVHIKAEENLIAHRDSIYLFHREIARACRKKEDVFIKDGVFVKSGGFELGGSYASWETVLKKGSEIVITDIPTSLVDKFESDILTLKVANEESELKDKLEREKLALVERLEDIDKQLLELTSSQLSSVA